MIFRPTPLAGAWLLVPERHADDRGWFARTWCRDELAGRGLDAELAQCSVSFNHRRGTVRGMHYQIAPHAETKVVRCTRGAVFDAIVDLRTGSPTHGRHFAAELSAAGGEQLYVPRGFAHGFQTLADDSEVSYWISAGYAPASAGGLRWDDAEVGIRWPLAVSALSERDGELPPLAGHRPPGVDYREAESDG